MNNLTLRIITALIGVTVIIGSIFINDWTFIIVFSLISILTHIEYIRTTSTNLTGHALVSAGFVLLLGIIWLTLYCTEKCSELRSYFPVIIIVTLPVIMILELYAKRENPFQQIGLQILGLIYIPLSFSLFILQGMPSQHNEWFALGVLFMVWSNDTFAYFAGRWLGKHKLFERISPKKTWEGFAGGLIMTVVCGYVMSTQYNNLSMADWMGLGVVISVAGTFGDLVESMLKRSIDIKDSGSLLPGHGGFLDRFDGFLLAVPAATAYFELLDLLA